MVKSRFRAVELGAMQIVVFMAMASRSVSIKVTISSSLSESSFGSRSER